MDAELTNAPAIKGAIPECLDAMSRHDDARALLKRLRAEIEALRKKDFRSLDAVFAKHLLAPMYKQAKQSQAIAAYLKSCWFDETAASAYFPELQPIAPIYAAGILTTLRLSLRAARRPTPIDAWWLPGHRHFEMINLVSPQQVTLLIATPSPGIIRKARPGLIETEVWTTKRSKVDSLQFVQKPG